MSRKIGDEFEDYLCRYLNLRKTSNSGATWSDGDLIPKNKDLRLYIEAKVKNTKEGFHITKAELRKIKNQSREWGLDWLFFMKDMGGEIYALMPLVAFKRLCGDKFNG